MRRRLSFLLSVLLVLSLTYRMFPMAKAVLFTDVSYSTTEGELYDAIMYVADNGYMVGTDTYQFSPTMQMNRAQMVQLLYQMAGQPAANYPIPFTDVPTTAWYYHAVCWAYHEGITDGTTDTTFSPNWVLIRQQTITFLYRYAIDYCGLPYTPVNVLSQYADGSSVAEYARPAMNWAVRYWIVQPNGSNQLLPTASTNRGTMAVFLCRYDKNAVGFIDGKKKSSFLNNTASCSMNSYLMDKIYAWVDSHFSSEQAADINENIATYSNENSPKCIGISFCHYLDATGTINFNRAVGNYSTMRNVPSFLSNTNVRMGLNFYQVSSYALQYYRTKANSASGIAGFSEEIRKHGPAIIGYYWYVGSVHHGHCIIVNNITYTSSGHYVLECTDPNNSANTYKTMHLYVIGNTITFDDKTISSFEYYSFESMQQLRGLDLDGLYNLEMISSE